MRHKAAWIALVAPTFPVLVLSVTVRVVAGWDDGISWGIVPFSVLYGLWNMGISAFAALGCAKLALGWARAARDDRNVFALAICGVYGLVPWGLFVSVDCLREILGAAWAPHGPFAWLRDWVHSLPSTDPNFAWPYRPTSRVFWILVGPGLAITALGLLIAARFVPAAARLGFFLIWCAVLALLVSVVCGFI